MVHYFVISNNDRMNTIAFTSLWPCVLLLKHKFLTIKCKVCLFSDIDGCWKIASNDVSSVYNSVCGKGECCFSSLPHWIIKYILPISKMKNFSLLFYFSSLIIPFHIFHIFIYLWVFASHIASLFMSFSHFFIEF